MFDNNATTLWETWEGNVHAIGQHGTSRNHIMFGGGVNRFIAAAMGGLSVDTRPLALAPTGTVHGTGSRVDGYGWRRMMVRPSPHAIRRQRPDAGYGSTPSLKLREGNAHRRTPFGEAAVAWRRKSGSGAVLELEVTVPPFSVADVHVPLLLTEVDLGSPASRSATDIVATVTIGACAVHCASDLTISYTESTTNQDLPRCDPGSSAAGSAICHPRLDGELSMSFEVSSTRQQVFVLYHGRLAQ
jgi:hypothetical protein